MMADATMLRVQVEEDLEEANNPTLRIQRGVYSAAVSGSLSSTSR
jgi:hypothetical protein